MGVNVQFHTEQLEQANKKLAEAETALDQALALAEIRRREEVLLLAD